MFFMFNPSKKIERKNRLAKEKSLSAVADLISVCSDMQNVGLGSELVRLRTGITGLASSEATGVLEHYYKIVRYLSDLQGDFSRGFTGAADVRISHIKTEMADIRKVVNETSTAFKTKKEKKTDKELKKEFEIFEKKYGKSTADEYIKNIGVDELYTSDDLFEIVIRQKQDEVNICTREIENLTEQFMEDPGNMAIKSTLNNVKYKKKTAETILANYAEARKKGSVAEFMGRVSEEAKQAMSMAGISDSELQVLYDNYRKEMEKINGSNKLTNGIINVVMGNSGNQAQANSNLNGLTGNTNTSLFVDAGSVQSVKPNGIKGYDEETLTEMLTQANISLKFWQKQREKMQEQFDEANSKLGSLSAQTRPMLAMYYDIVAQIKAGAVELNTTRMKYEQELKKKQKDIESAKNSMDKAAQDLDKCDKHIAIFEDFVDIIKSQLRDNQFSNISGEMAKNLDNIAMILRKSVQESNKDFEHVNDLYNVARGEGYIKDEFNMNVSSLNDGIEEDKFKELRKFLGME